MNPLIAKIIESMANRDGTLSQAFATTRSGPDGIELVQGSGQHDQVHPAAGTRPQQGLGQHPVIIARTGAGPRTGPTDAEAYARSSGGLTHTTGEKGLGMAINPQAIQSIMQMMMQGQQNGTGPAPVPNVPGPMTPEMVMQMMQGGGGGGGGSMPQGMDQEGQHFDPEDQNEGPETGPPDAEDRGESTEQELANVHGEMTKANPAQLTEELRQCLQDNDRKGCEKILQEMEAGGIPIDKLPPDIQQQLQRDGYLDDGSDGDGADSESAEGDHEYR